MSYVRSCSDKIGGFCDLCIVSGRVSLLSGVFFCILGSIVDVYGYLGAIYSCPAVKVTPGHECYGPFP